LAAVGGNAKFEIRNVKWQAEEDSESGPGIFNSPFSIFHFSPRVHGKRKAES
jgi:hypothetical protein